MTTTDIRLSKSALEAFKTCPRCFYLEKVHKIKVPEGIRAGVPMGIDRVLKSHYDRYRLSGTMPPELADVFPVGTRLYNGVKVDGTPGITIKNLRYWGKGLRAQVGDAALSTALDDLLILPDNTYAMLDYKSKAKATDDESTRKYYQTQADCYDLALNAEGYPTHGDAFFAYYFPEAVVGGHGPSAPEHGEANFKWGVQVIKIKADHDGAKLLTTRGSECLASPTAPASSPTCEQCSYIVARNAYDGMVPA